MSLPPGVLNHHTVDAARPAVWGGFLRIAVRVVWIALPLIIHSAAQAPGVDSRYESENMRKEISDFHDEIRLLQAERASLRSPDRLMDEAQRLGLTPIPLQPPVTVETRQVQP